MAVVAVVVIVIVVVVDLVFIYKLILILSKRGEETVADTVACTLANDI